MKKFALLLLITGISFFTSQKYAGLTVQDSYDYAQLSRNISENNTFESLVIIPATIKKQNKTNVDMWRAPVYPLLISTFFRIFGTSELTMILLCLAAYFVFLLVTYLLASSMYDQKTALLACILVGFTPEICWYTLLCLREPLFCLLFTLTMYLLYTCRYPLTTGFVFALTYLTRYNFLFFLPSFFIYLFIRYKKQQINRTFLIKVIATFIITLAPWCMRNIANGLSPLFTLQRHEVALFTKDYPHYTIYRHIDIPSPSQYAQQNFSSICEKAWYYSLLHYWPKSLGIPPLHTHNIPKFFSPKWEKFVPLEESDYSISNLFRIQNGQFSLYTLTFIYASILLLLYKSNSNRIFYFALMSGLFLQIFALSFIHPVTRHCIPFIAVSIVFICGELLSKLDNNKLIIIGLLFLFLSVITVINTPKTSTSIKTVTSQSMDFIKQNTPPDACIATNVPFELAWQTKRQTLWLPVTLEDYKKFEEKYPNLRYFYYHPRKKTDWRNTHPDLKEYLHVNYRCTYRYENGQTTIYFFEKHGK